MREISSRTFLKNKRVARRLRSLPLSKRMRSMEVRQRRRWNRITRVIRWCYRRYKHFFPYSVEKKISSIVNFQILFRPLLKFPRASKFVLPAVNSPVSPNLVRLLLTCPYFQKKKIPLLNFPWLEIISQNIYVEIISRFFGNSGRGGKELFRWQR